MAWVTCDDAEHVCLVDLPDGGGGGLTRLLRSGGDRGVVDEDVEAAERGVDVLGGGLDRDLVGDVQRYEPYVGSVGAKLLTTRQVRLTTAGQVLLDQARIAVDAVHAAARRARRAGQPTPQLVVAVKPGGDAGLLREILAAYQGTGSHLPPPEVVVGGSGEPIAMLRDGRADVALLRSPFDGQGLDSQTLVVEPRLAVLPAGHRLAGRRRLRLTDLKGEPIPRWKGAAPSTTAYYTGCDGAEAGDGHTGLTPADTPEGPLVASVEQLLEVVALGQAVAFLSLSTTKRHQRPDIAYRPVTGLSPSAVMVAWPETSRSAAVAAFVQAAHDVAADQPDHMTALAF